MKYLLPGLAVTTALIFSGCGGTGGENETPFDPNTTFNLSKYNSSNISMSLAGSDTEGNVISSTVSTSLQSQDNTQKIFKSYVNMTLNESVNVAQTTINTVDSSGRLISTVNQTNGTECYLGNNPSPLPADAKVGYFTDTFSYSCSDGNDYTMIGALIVGENGLGNFTWTYNYTDGTSSKATAFLKPNGTATAYKLVVNYPAYDVTMTLNSTNVVMTDY